MLRDAVICPDVQLSSSVEDHSQCQKDSRSKEDGFRSLDSNGCNDWCAVGFLRTKRRFGAGTNALILLNCVRM